MRLVGFLITFISFAVAMVGTYVLSRALTALSMRLALRWGIVSPVTARSSHTEPTPRLGGVGLAAGFGAGALFFLLVVWHIPHEGAMIAFNPSLVLWTALGWLGMFAVGLLDDLFDLRPLTKLGLMTLAALAPTWGGGLVIDAANYFSVPTWVNVWLNIALTVLWILFFTNGFNFMDGMDGFAANFARISASFLFIILLVAGLRFGNIPFIRAEAYLLPILAMACWGFLHWNRPPAKVFMGDGGSLSVGYLLAVYVIIGYRHSLGLSLSLVSSLTVLLPFIFDVVLTLIRRARLGQNLLQAHREHLYQRLLRAGLSHSEALVANIICFSLCGLAALIGSLIDLPPWRWICFSAALAIMLAYWRWTLWRERRAELKKLSAEPDSLAKK